jgi:hypothetical protein
MDNKQLKKSIQLIHSKNGDYKTVISGSEKHLYLVVTRVNYLTACLWLNEVKKEKTKIELPAKPNWLVMNRSFRREFKNGQ